MTKNTLCATETIDTANDKTINPSCQCKFKANVFQSYILGEKINGDKYNLALLKIPVQLSFSESVYQKWRSLGTYCIILKEAKPISTRMIGFHFISQG